MDFLGYKITDITQHNQMISDYTLEIFDKKSYNVLKTFTNNHNLVPFECKVVSILDYKIITSLKVSGEYILCNNFRLDVKNDIFFKNFDCTWLFVYLSDWPFCICKNTGFGLTLVFEEDTAICFNCLGSLYTEFHNCRGSFLKLAKKHTNGNESLCEKIVSLFEEDDPFFTIDGDNEGGEKSDPDHELKVRKKQISKLNDDVMKYIKFDQCVTSSNIKVNPFYILRDIFEKEEYTKVKEDSASGFAGKSNHEYIYQIGTICGLLNKNKYK